MLNQSNADGKDEEVMTEEPLQKTDEEVAEDDAVNEEPVAEEPVAEEEAVAPSFGEIKNEAKEEVAEVAERVKKAGLTPFRRAVDDVVDRGLGLLDTLADVWAGKKKSEKKD